jgi:DNA-binding MarR family transcriptional regulator
VPLSSLTRLLRIVEELRKLDPEMPMQAAGVLLLLAKEPGTTQIELLARAGVSKSSVNRIFARLSDRPGGLGLLSMKEDPEDLRRKITNLTSRGKLVITSLERIIEE